MVIIVVVLVVVSVVSAVVSSQFTHRTWSPARPPLSQKNSPVCRVRMALSVRGQRVVWCGVEWCGVVVWCGVVWCGGVSGVVRSGGEIWRGW